jgi:hypothetical protein
MTRSIFEGRTHQPDDADLARALAGTHDLWNELRAEIASRFGPLSETWGFSSASTGWGLRLAGPKRTVLYLTPLDGSFLASFALGEHAVSAVREAGPSSAVLDAIAAAPRYAEGRGVQLTVASAGDVQEIVRLAEVKMAH